MQESDHGRACPASSRRNGFRWPGVPISPRATSCRCTTSAWTSSRFAICKARPTYSMPTATSPAQPVQRMRRRGRHPMSVPRLRVERRRPQRANPVRKSARSRPQDEVLASHPTRRIHLHLARRVRTLPDVGGAVGLRSLGDHIHDRDYAPVGPEARIKLARFHVTPRSLPRMPSTPITSGSCTRPRSARPCSRNVDDVIWSAKVGFGRRWSDGFDVPGEPRTPWKSTGRASASRRTASTPGRDSGSSRYAPPPSTTRRQISSPPTGSTRPAAITRTPDGCAGGVAGRHHDLG